MVVKISFFSFYFLYMALLVGLAFCIDFIVFLISSALIYLVMMLRRILGTWGGSVVGYGIYGMNRFVHAYGVVWIVGFVTVMDGKASVAWGNDMLGQREYAMDFRRKP